MQISFSTLVLQDLFFGILYILASDLGDRCPLTIKGHWIHPTTDHSFFYFLQLRVRREQATSSFAETEMEKSAHRQTKETLDLSEKTVSLKNIKKAKRCRHSDLMTYLRLL